MYNVKRVGDITTVWNTAGKKFENKNSNSNWVLGRETIDKFTETWIENARG